MGVWVGEPLPTSFLYGPKDAQENSTSFDINIITGDDRENMVLNEKVAENGTLRGLKLRGSRKNQIKRYFYEIKQTLKLLNFFSAIGF